MLTVKLSFHGPIFIHFKMPRLCTKKVQSTLSIFSILFLAKYSSTVIVLDLFASDEGVAKAKSSVSERFKNVFELFSKKMGL